MIAKLVLKSLRNGKARFLCAALGVAAAVGAVVFVFSLTATNSAQAPALAERAVTPWAAWKIDGEFGGRGRGPKPASKSDNREKVRGKELLPQSDLRMQLLAATIDYRPGGRVLQGPPMRAILAKAPVENPYASTKLTQGRWVDQNSSECEIVCTRGTLSRFGRTEPPELGEVIKFVGEKGTMSAKLVGYLDDIKLPMGFPNVFANTKAFDEFKDEKRGSITLWKNAVTGQGVLTPKSESVVNSFKGDEQRRMDYARPLMLIAAVLTALALLVNSLLLSVEANRKSLAILRTIGLTRFGAVRFVVCEAFIASFVGLVLGIVGALTTLYFYVAADTVAFPTGMVFDWRIVVIASLVMFAVTLLAVLFALKPVLGVKPLDAFSVRRRSRRIGMAIAFAFGFGSFVAVEIWGASLMRGFVPSPEWPDAIVSLLPGGASSFDVEKLRNIEGVKRISKLLPLQVDLPPIEGAKPQTLGPRPYTPNALFLAAEWLPEFVFVEGNHKEAQEAIQKGDACVITHMMSRARSLKKGDKLTVLLGGRRGPKREVALPIAGVVDVNWHMVTSRGLVRGLNGASGMTDGPVFVSFDTLKSLDARPAFHVRMTHLWVEYEKEFLEKHGVFPAGRKIESDIANALGNNGDYTVRLHARDEIADGTLAHGSDIIGQAARVPFVFLAILAIGFIAMLVAEADASKRDYVILRAVGATRAQLVWVLTSKALKTAFWGIVIALIPGALAGWLFAIKTASVWPGMPHYFVVPWQIIVEGAVGAVVFALIISVPSAMVIIRRASKR